MPDPYISDLDDGSGSNPSGPYFQLSFSSYSQSIYWDAQTALPAINAFNIGFAKNQITDPYLEFYTTIGMGISPDVSISTTGMTGSIIDGSGSGKNIQPSISNLPALPNGTYTIEINFSAYGKVNGVNTLLDNVSYIIFLEVYNNDAVTIKPDKTEYNVLFNRQTNTLSGETSVVIENNTVPENLDFTAQYFITKNNVTTGFTIEGDNLATQPTLPTTGFLEIIGSLKKGSNTISPVKINLSIVNSSDLVANKTSLSFQLKKSVPETASQSFYLTNPENQSFTITKPSWLNLSATSGNASMNIVATTVNSSTLNGGAYNGNIVISYGTKTLVIPVSLFVVSFVNVFLEAGDNFCNDIPKVVFNKMNSAARFVKVTLKAVYELLGEITETENVFQVPYIAGFGEFALGEKVNSYFPEFSGNPFEFSGTQIFRKPAIVEIKSEELNINYEVIHTEIISDIHLWPGKKPAGYPLLSSLLHRKKNKGSILFTSEIKNNQIEVNKVSSENVAEITFGSEILKLYNLGEVWKPIHVAWENQNKSIEWFTFTGIFKRNPEYSQVYSKNIWDGRNKKFGFTKNISATINTGFLLKVEENLIEQLIESPLVHLQNGAKTYVGFFVNSKYETENSEDELFEKTLEFVIAEEYGN